MEGSSKKKKNNTTPQKKKEAQPLISEKKPSNDKPKEKTSNEITQKRLAKERKQKEMAKEIEQQKVQKESPRSEGKKKKQKPQEIVQEEEEEEEQIEVEKPSKKESKVPKENSSKKRKVSEEAEASNEDQITSLKKKIRAENPLYDQPLVELDTIEFWKDEENEKEEMRRKGIIEEAPMYTNPSKPIIPQTAVSSVAKQMSGENEFCSLPLHDTVQFALKDMGFETMTQVQQLCIPQALLGRDVLVSAKTGSGKTLAFLIPALQFLIQAGFKKRNGTGVMIISPTRELALQTYGVAKELFKYNELKTVGIVTGGMPKEPEEAKLRKGCNVLIASPGRLLDHLKHTSGFNFHNLRCLIIDEADRLLETGFADEMKEIISLLPATRQTMLFSATQTRSVQDLARLSLKNKPHEVHVDSDKEIATAEGLEQGYVICDTDVRFLLLYTFLKKYSSKKIIVFFSSCASVQFHTELLNYIDVPVLSLHGKQKQQKRAKTFFEFINAEKGILICTDVAARGLDIPKVDWIIQYDPPDDPKEYIHRVGRTARGVGGVGKALIFLLPSEVKFLKYLKDLKVPLEEYDFPRSRITNIQSQLETLVATVYSLNMSARDAYKGYLSSYATHSHRDIFDAQQLDLRKLSLSFGLPVPPKVDLRQAHRTGPAQDVPRYDLPTGNPANNVHYKPPKNNKK